jgi:hypothetical protein
MTDGEKIRFLMETIPSEDEVQAIRRRYLLTETETSLLTDAVRTLKSSHPDQNIVDWAYDLLRMKMAKKAPKSDEHVPLETKMEQIIALFSNPEDLEIVLKHDAWGPTEKRLLGLVSHFVANGIPLMSNVKIVEKVYDLLSSAYLPHDIAFKYFGHDNRLLEHDLLMKRYSEYRRVNTQPAPEAVPSVPKKESFLKRYTYMLGAILTIASIFMAGFLSAKWIYEPKGVATMRVSAAQAENGGRKQGVVSGAIRDICAPMEQNASELFYRKNRLAVVQGLAKYGLAKLVDFAMPATPGKDEGVRGEDREGGKLFLKREAPGGTRFVWPADGHLKASVAMLAKLKGLKLPIVALDINLSDVLDMAGEKSFRLEAKETSASRLVYATDGARYFPVEIYTFVGEPMIIGYRLINFKPGHYIPVVSNIWHFSNIGELREHRHFVYLQNRVTPAKIVSTRFLPGYETVETESVVKRMPDGSHEELPLLRTDYATSGKLLYKERYTVHRDMGRWKSDPVRRIWYADGKKIHIQDFGGK